MTELTSEWAYPLTFTKNGKIIWTVREDQRLMNSYTKIPKEKVLEILPGRNWNAIKHRAYRLKIPRKGLNYTPEEDSHLVNLYYHTNLTYNQMSQYFMFRDGKSLKARMYYIRRRNSR